METTKRNFWLDVTIFMAFLITIISGFFLWLAIPHQFESVFLGFSRREWVAAHISFGVVGLIGVAWHIVWHWDWLKALRGRRLHKIRKKVRTNRVIDRIMWLAYIATNGFGMIAWALHYGDQVYLVRMPDRLHVIFGIVCSILMIAHLVLHWKWIASSAKRFMLIEINPPITFRSKKIFRLNHKS